MLIRWPLIAALLFSLPQAWAESLHLAVAANFTDAARELTPLFERESGHSIKLSYGSTGKLYAQIAHGAPFEVFLAADVERPQRAEVEGLAVAGSRFTYAVGRLALWSPEPGVFDDGEAYLKAGVVSRAAMANPKTAPYGRAAREVMEYLGVWSTMRPRMVRGDSIAQTFQFSASGNVDVGFVAYSQVKAWTGEGSAWLIPQDYHAPIAQQAVLLKRGENNSAAKAFIEFLKGDVARGVIAGYGYGL